MKHKEPGNGTIIGVGQGVGDVKSVVKRKFELRMLSSPKVVVTCRGNAKVMNEMVALS